MPRKTRKASMPELNERDRWIVVELIRFGVLEEEHLARRYELKPASWRRRMSHLCQQGFVKANKHWLHPTRIFLPAPLAYDATGLRKPPYRLFPQQLAHHLAVADLADRLLEEDRTAGWLTENELRINRRQEDPFYSGRRNAHVPDGLLLRNDRRIAIEVEISRKRSERYAEICRWYAEQIEVDELHWYVAGAALRRYIDKVVDRFGLGIDLGIQTFPFPPGVRVRKWE
jgi:hypothetical protein